MLIRRGDEHGAYGVPPAGSVRAAAAQCRSEYIYNTYSDDLSLFRQELAKSMRISTPQARSQKRQYSVYNDSFTRERAVI